MPDREEIPRTIPRGGRLATAILRQEVRVSVTLPDRRKHSDTFRRGIIRIGRSPENDLVIDEDAVSAMHAELELTPDGIVLRDVGSLNGTFIDKVRVREVLLPDRAVFGVGDSTVRIEAGEEFEVPLAAPGRHGIVGESIPLREALGLLEKYAGATQSLVIQGETGTGKEVFARALHQMGPRCSAPFIVLDCGGINPSLAESELFGHKAGAFSGAAEDRAGVFESADGGVLLLDHVDELPLAVQPKLLRVLEARELSRLGETGTIPVDVRVVASCQRDLTRLVAEGAFRQDLFFRLNVLHLDLPPLRKRKEDIPPLVRSILGNGFQIDDAALDMLLAYHWPGNIRELKSMLLRVSALSDTRTLGTADIARAARPPPLVSNEASGAPVDPALPYHEAKSKCLSAFELTYIRDILLRHQGNLTHAAETAEIPARTLRRLAAKHGLRRPAPDPD